MELDWLEAEMFVEYMFEHGHQMNYIIYVEDLGDEYAVNWRSIDRERKITKISKKERLLE